MQIGICESLQKLIASINLSRNLCLRFPHIPCSTNSLEWSHVCRVWVVQDRLRLGPYGYGLGLYNLALGFLEAAFRSMSLRGAGTGAPFILSQCEALWYRLYQVVRVQQSRLHVFCDNRSERTSRNAICPLPSARLTGHARGSSRRQTPSLHLSFTTQTSCGSWKFCSKRRKVSGCTGFLS